jgi:hypothetical protein
MKVWNVTEKDIRAAAEAAGVTIFSDWRRGGVERAGKTERAPLKFRLALGSQRAQEGHEERERNEAGKLKPAKLHPIIWQRRTASVWSADSERRVAAVCWHGHYSFMRHLLALHPDARIKSAIGDYRGLAGFLATAPETGYRNIGSQVYPVQMREACFCADYGRDYLRILDDAADAWAEALSDPDKGCRCDKPEIATCGNCVRSWCARCDPAPSALCHYCHGRGFSLAPLPFGGTDMLTRAQACC